MIARLSILALLAAAALTTRLCASGESVDISGTVTDSATGLPIPGASVRLLVSAVADTTDTAGRFRLQGTAASALTVSRKTVSSPFLAASNRLEFDNDKRQFVSLNIHDIRGRAVAQLSSGAADAGHYSVIPSRLTTGRFLYVLRIGNKLHFIPFLVIDRVSGGPTITRTVSAPQAGYLRKAAGVFKDTACAAKTGYPVKKVAVSSAVITDLPIRLSRGVGTLTQERATPEQVALYLPLSRALDDRTMATLHYRTASEQNWRIAHPLLRIHPDWIESSAPIKPVDAFAGTIFDLSPATSYEVMVTVSEPGSEAIVYTAMCSTRSLPPPAPSPTVTAAPGDNLQQKLNSLVPGDALLLADGIYNVQNLTFNVAGTEAKPVYVKGASRSGVIIRDSLGTVLQILKASHIVFENFTLQGSKVDDSTNAGSIGVSFWDGELQEDITFRDLTIDGTDMGIVAWGAVNSTLVYNCILNGNNVWTKGYIETNRTWNDDGIRLPGEGNCGFENTLRGFGDAFAVNNGVFSAAVYFYRNLVAMTGDDAFEADYGTRNMGFYDNHITNSATLLSTDPIWGGPLYCFRNTMINTIRGPFKLNNTNSGFVIYNNTIVRTEGTTNWGWVQFDNGSLRNWAYRNNVLIYRGPGNLLAIESTINDPIDFTNNAWYPDRAVWWTKTGGSFASMALARQQVPATNPVVSGSTRRHENDVITTSNPFVDNVIIGSDHLTEIKTVFTPTPAVSSTIKNAGVPIPGITDGYSGSNPDMGSIIEGRTVPRWGAK